MLRLACGGRTATRHAQRGSCGDRESPCLARTVAAEQIARCGGRGPIGLASAADRQQGPQGGLVRRSDERLRGRRARRGLPDNQRRAELDDGHEPRLPVLLVRRAGLLRPDGADRGIPELERRRRRALDGRRRRDLDPRHRDRSRRTGSWGSSSPTPSTESRTGTSATST